MGKALQKFATVFFAFGYVLCCIMLVTALDVSTSVQITGTGDIDHMLKIDSNAGKIGYEYSEEIVTPYLGLYSDSKINLSSNMLSTHGSGPIFNANTTFNVDNVKTAFTLSNYDIGAIQTSKFGTDVNGTLNFRSTNATSFMAIDTSVVGHSDIQQRGVESSYKYPKFKEHTDMTGSFHIGMVSEMKANNESELEWDWLPCP